MEKKKENIKKIENFSAEEFAEWLRKGIDDLHNGKVESFKPLHYLIGESDNIISDLSNIYNASSDKSQKRFRNGIVIGLYGYPEKISLEVAATLLRLAGEISCKEILPVINNWVNQYKFYFLPKWDRDPEINNEKQQEFFALVLRVIAELSPANGVAHTLRKLVGVKLFHYEYAPLVFTALCHAEPKNFISHLDLLRDHFKILHERGGYTNVHITARHIVCYVPLDIITENLWRADKWLIKGLLVGKKAPLALVIKR